MFNNVEDSAVPAAASLKVTLRHPHTGDIREVEATPAALVPLMNLGYAQHRPPMPAQGE